MTYMIIYELSGVSENGVFGLREHPANGSRRSEVRGDSRVTVVQHGLPRALRNMNQACQVDPFDGVVEPLALDPHTFISDQDRSHRKRTRLDVLFNLLPNLPRQLSARDRFPVQGVIVGVYLSKCQRESTRCGHDSLLWTYTDRAQRTNRGGVNVMLV